MSSAATTWPINLSEQGRGLGAGTGMVMRAEVPRFADFCVIIGMFILATSAVLLVIPLSRHNGYAVFWARHLLPAALRARAPFAVFAGAALVWPAPGG
ncbi:MAG: hypothetical protein ACK4IS_02155 [Erythrobacter sp.]